MKILFALIVLSISVTLGFGQNEQSPIVEKEVNFKNWAYKDVHTGETVDLRNFTKGKKLVAVVYFAPWCPNWRHDAPMLEKLYEKYKANGFGVIGVSEYDTVDAAIANLDTLKITFPAVGESFSRADKQKTLHDDYRKTTGDNRGWGSPWYIFLMPSMMEKKGDTLTKKTFVINGEMIEAEGEKFIREKLGLPAVEAKAAAAATAANDKIEVCDADKKPALVIAPAAKTP